MTDEVLAIIGTQDAVRGDEDAQFDIIRQRALNATRNPECTREFLAHAPADIEWLIEIAEGRHNHDECDVCNESDCYNCERLEERLDDCRQNLRAARQELTRVEDERDKLLAERLDPQRLLGEADKSKGRKR